MQKISKYTLSTILTTLPKWPAVQSTGFCPHCANVEGEGSEKVNNLPQGHRPGGDSQNLNSGPPGSKACALCTAHIH